MPVMLAPMADRTILLGLRSNVKYFSSRHGFAKLSDRVKGLSLLYDRVLLEEGVYEAHIGDNAATESVGSVVDDSQLRPLRNRVGAPFGVGFGKTGTTEFHSAVTDANVQSFRSQFRSLANEMAAGKADWFDVVTPTTRYQQIAKDLADSWNGAEVRLLEDLWPNMHPRLRTVVHENLNLDLATAGVLGAHLAPDALHQPLLHAKASSYGGTPHGTGERTLWVVLPKVAAATWDDIANLRKDAGLADLRVKLAEIDQRALEGEDAYQLALQEVLDEAERGRPRWFASGLWSVLNLVSGQLAPALTAVGIANDLRRSRRAYRSWTAALVRARQRIRRSEREQEWLRLS